MQRYAGVDEAGRGCVIGPLVVAIVVATETDKRAFRRWNVRDSKIVPAAERTLLATRIAERCWHATRIATPAEIDTAVTDRSRTLNGLEREQMAALLHDARRAHPSVPLHATVDAPSANAARFQADLCADCGWTPTELVARHHADATDITVAAASIVAKHHREQLLASLKQTLGTNCGSGYPSDPTTIAYMKNAPQNAAHIRWSWATAQRVRRGLPKP
jgi:ribonuclease HII